MSHLRDEVQSRMCPHMMLHTLPLNSCMTYLDSLLLTMKVSLSLSSPYSVQVEAGGLISDYMENLLTSDSFR